MQAPLTPHNEAQRLKRLRQLGVLDTEAEAVLDALADHLEAHLDVPGLLALAR